MNGELWGRALPESMRGESPAWSVKYPTQITERWLRAADTSVELDGSTVLQIAEDFSLPTDGVAIEVLRSQIEDAAIERLDAIEPLRNVLPPMSPEVFPSRVVEEAYEGNEQVIDTVQPLLTPYYPSQLFQALTDGPLLIALMFIVWWKPRRVGVPASWFLLGYGVMRIASEGLRQPDEGVAQLAGFSRGQVLSVAMVVIGAALLVWCSKRANASKCGGLGVVAESSDA